MGWLQDLFRIKKKKSDEDQISDLSKESLSAIAVESWVESKKDLILKECNFELKRKLSELKELKGDLEQKTDGFQLTKLRNPNIPPRELQMMQGSKELFLKRLRLFNSSFKVPDTVDSDELTAFVKVVEKEIELFNKLTERSFQVLQFFFANEVRAIISDMNRIDKTIVGIRSILLENPALREYKVVISSSRQLLELIDAEKKLASEEEDLILRKQSLINIAKSFSDKISKYAKSEEYAEYENLVNEKELIKKERATKKQELSELFYPLEKLLRKMAKGHLLEKLIARYLDDPCEGLMVDNNLDIVQIIADAAQNAKNSDIGLKERMKDKAIAAAQKLNFEMLNNYRDRCIQLTLLSDQLSRRIQNNPIRLAHNKMVREHEFAIAGAEEIEKDLKRIGDLREKQNVSLRQKGLEDKLSALTKIDVEIKR